MVRHCHGSLVLADCLHLMERSIQVAREACNQESLSKWTVTWPDSDEGCFLLYYSEVGQKILQRAPYGSFTKENTVKAHVYIGWINRQEKNGPRDLPVAHHPQMG